MKRILSVKCILSLISVLIMIFVLCSCSSVQKQYTVEKNGITFEVNKENKTISDGTNIYIYNFEGNDSNYDVDITYPDGSTYWWNMKEYGGSGGWSDNYDPQKYVDGDVLTNVLLEDAPKAPKHTRGNSIAIFLLIVLGIFNIVAPHSAWYLEYGWRYKDAEPSDLAISFNRLGGVVAVVIAIVLLFA